ALDASETVAEDRVLPFFIGLPEARRDRFPASTRGRCGRRRSRSPVVIFPSRRLSWENDGEIDLPGCGMLVTRSTNSLISFLGHEHRNCFPVSVDFPCEWWFPLYKESFPISGFNFSVDPPIGIASRSDWSAAEPFDQFAESRSTSCKN
ncbi:hypothetical protein U1Q18_002774, partial [Sarracenia purpurea var. burkii]